MRVIMNYAISYSFFTYSDWELPDLDENNLDETKPLDPEGLLDGYVPPIGSTYNRFYRNGAIVTVNAADLKLPIDYNNNGTKTDTGLQMDINNDSPPNLTVLKGANDWETLRIWTGAVGGTYGAINTIIYYSTVGGAANMPETQTKLWSKSITLSSLVPSRSGYQFLGWATANNRTVVYQPGDVYSEQDTVTLYAVWKLVGAPLTLSVPANVTDTAAQAVTLFSYTPAVSGTYTFASPSRYTATRLQVQGESSGGTTLHSGEADAYASPVPNWSIVLSYDLEAGTEYFFSVYTRWSPISPYDVVLFKGDPYQVTFDGNGGTVAAANQSRVKIPDLTLDIPAASPTRTGYTFLGWNENKADADAGTAQYTRTGNWTYTANAATTMYAVWTANTYTVTYSLGGGTQQAGTWNSYTYGVGLTLPTAPTRTNYTFAGWYDNAGLTGTPVTAISAADTGNKTYWAKWTANTYTVTYNLDGGTQQAGSWGSYTYGVGLVLPTAPTRTNYTFAGWYDNAGLTGTPVTAIPATDTGNKTYWAKWTVITYTVTYNLGGGTQQAGSWGSYASGIGLTLPIPTRANYTFAGWYDNAGLTGTPVTAISAADTGNKTYWAKWTANTYTVTYNLDGGTQQAGSWGSYTYGVGMVLPTAPTRANYTFAGWYDNAGLTGPPVNVISSTDTGNKTFWAKWAANTYTVTYNLDGGTQQAGSWGSYAYGVGLTLPTAPTKANYTFAGWYDNAGLTGTPVTAIPATATVNKEFWAKWTANTYTVTYNLDGGTQQAGSWGSYAYGVGLTLPTAPTKVNHTFAGWYDNAGLTGTPVTAISAADTGNKTFWAKWTANTTPVAIEGPSQVQISYKGSITFAANQAAAFTANNEYVQLEKIDEKTVKVTSSKRFFWKSSSAVITASDGSSSASVTVNIKPTFVQYLIIILLFGWIWY